MPVNIGAIEATLSLQDNLTAPLGKARDSLGRFTSSLAKSATDINGSSKSIEKSYKGISGAIKSVIDDLDKSAKRIQKSGREIQNIGSQLSKTVTLPIAAIGGLSIKAASDFDSSFSNINRTVEGVTDSLGNLTKVGAELQKGLRDLAAGPNPVPVDVNELNNIAASAGQLGIPQEKILDFTKTMAQLGEVTNLSADEAATSIAQLQYIFDAPGKEVDRFGATLTALGLKGASTEKSILEMAQRIAGAGHQVGLSQGQVLAVANALSSVGIEAEAGGSAISKVMVDMAVSVQKGGRELHNFAAVAGMSTSEFKKRFQEDAAGALLSFVEGMGQIKASGGSVLKVLTDMGITQMRERDALVRLAGAGGLMRDSLQLQAKAWQDNTALTDAAEKKNKTFENQLKITRQRLNDAAITLGTALLPVLRDLISALEPGIKMIAGMAQTFSELPKPVRTVIVVIAGGLAVLGPFLFMLGQLVISFGAVAGAAPAVIGVLSKIQFGISGILGVIPLLLLGINQLITSWKEALDQAIEYDVKTSEIEGRALRFAQKVGVNKGVGKPVNQSELDQANKDIADLRSAIRQAKLKIQQGTDLGVDTSEDVANLKSLEQAYGRASQAVAGAAVVADKAGSAVAGAGASAKSAAGNLNILTKEGEKAASAIQKIIDGLNRQAAKSAALAKAAAKGPVSLRDEEDRQAVLDELLQAQNSLREEGLSLSESQVAQITAAVVGERQHARELELVLKAQQLIGNLGYEPVNALEQMENKLKQNMPLWLAVEETTRRTIDQLEVGIDRLDAMSRGALRAFDFSIPIHDLQAAADLTEQMATDSERRTKALVEAARLRDQGTISDETFRRVQQSQANPLWTEAQEANRALVDDIITGFKSIGTNANQEIAKIEAAFADYGDNADLVLLKERAIADVRSKMLDGYLSQWGSFFSTVGNLFGGVFKQIGDAIGRIQQAKQAGDQLGSAVQGIGGGSSWGAAGGILAVVQIFYEVYNAVSKNIKKQRAAIMGEVTSLQAINGVFSSPQYFDRAGQEFNRSLRNLIDQILSTITGALDDLPEILIKARHDGKKFAVYVAGVFLGMFNDAQTAMEEAVSYAISTASFEGIGPELAQALQASIGKTLDELQANIATATTVRNARIGDAGAAYVEASDKYRQEIEAAQRLGLALTDLIAKRDKELQAITNSALGIDTSASDRLEGLRSLSAGIAEVADSTTAQLRQLINQTVDEITRLEHELTKPGGGIAGSGGVGGGTGRNPAGNFPGKIGDALGDTTDDIENQELARLRAALAQYTAELDKVPQALSDQQLSMGIFDTLYRFVQGNHKYDAEAIKYARMRVQIEFDLIKLKLIELGRWEQFAGMFNDAFNAAMQSAGKLPRSGGGGGKQDDVQSFLTDRRRDAAQRGMTDYQRQIDDVMRSYAEQIKAAGKNAAAVRELTALRNAEVAAINKEKAASTVESFRGFLGLVTPFDQVRETAEGLIKSIEDSPFGSARKASMILRVMDKINTEITRMSQESARGLLSEMLGDMERFGATDAQMFAARQNMAILEHGLKMAHYSAEIEILRAQGKLAPEVLAALDKSFQFLSGIDPTRFITGGAGGGETQQDLINAVAARQEQAAQDALEALRRAQDSLRSYQDDGLDSLTRSLRKINDDFVLIRRSLGNTPEVINTFNAAVHRAVTDFLQPVVDSQRDLFYGDTSTVGTMDQWARIQQEEQRMMARFRSGDLSVVGELSSFGQQFMSLAGQVLPRGSMGFAEISSQWDQFLTEVQQNAPDMAMGSALNPMAVAGLPDLVDIGEAQAETLGMIHQQTMRGAIATEALLARLQTPGGGMDHVM